MRVKSNLLVSPLVRRNEKRRLPDPPQSVNVFISTAATAVLSFDLHFDDPTPKVPVV
jgi:hypothetical protein